MAGKGIRSDSAGFIQLPFVSTVEGVDPNGPPIVGYTYELQATAPNGLPTTGFLFALITGAGAIATAPGFTVTVYRWLPIAQAWVSFAAKTSVNYGELYDCYDIDGGAKLFVRIDNVAAHGPNVGINIYIQEQ